MQGGKVGFRDLAGAGIVRQSGEIGLDEPGVRDAGSGRESASGSDVSRVEVDAGYLPGRIADGERECTEPMAAAELQIAERHAGAQIRRADATEQAGEMEMQRRLMPVVTRKVGYVRDVAATPVAHSRTRRCVRAASPSASTISASNRASAASARRMPGGGPSGAGIQEFQPSREGGSAHRLRRSGGISGPASTRLTAKPISKPRKARTSETRHCKPGRFGRSASNEARSRGPMR